MLGVEAGLIRLVDIGLHAVADRARTAKQQILRFKLVDVVILNVD